MQLLTTHHIKHISGAATSIAISAKTFADHSTDSQFNKYTERSVFEQPVIRFYTDDTISNVSNFAL
uniref:hypothetical protein n=1 Tax=Ningiella ruwaisensis TaxID=2364274 RepID=UPI0010A026B9|nr:hypothetical protein [Ningiella ruwaisensis]